MTNGDSQSNRVIWVLLVSSCLTLFFQLFPSIWSNLLTVIDVRNWSWTMIWIINILMLTILISYRAWINRNN